LYIPISKIDENMNTAHKMDACLNQKFWFRSSILPSDMCREATELVQLTLAEILIGTEDEVGVLKLCYLYLDFIGCDGSTRDTLETYLNFICMRASGKVKTPARWIRDFVLAHPTYQNDARVTPACAYDLVRKSARIAAGEEHAPQLLGCNMIKRLRPASYAALDPSNKEATNSCCGAEASLLAETHRERASELFHHFRKRLIVDEEKSMASQVKSLEAELEAKKAQLLHAEQALASFREEAKTFATEASPESGLSSRASKSLTSPGIDRRMSVNGTGYPETNGNH
jgi:hypothetical protein